jgi:hypothetical protein
MTDEQPKKGSLKGRGREIMQGSRDEERSPSSGGWLPHSSDDSIEEEPHFEDDEAVLKWMDVDPEAHRPTVIPTQKLATENIEQVLDDAEPDFDAIFREMPEESDAATLILPATPRPATQTLDDVFREEDPVFDELFGDVIPAETLDSEADDSTLESDLLTPPPPPTRMTLPETGELYADDLFDHDGVPGLTQDKVLHEEEPVLPPSRAAAGVYAMPEPEPEEADESVIVDDFEGEPAARADRRSPEVIVEDTEEPDTTVGLGAERVMPDEETWRFEEAPTHLIEPEPQESPEPFQAVSEATAILEEDFDDQPAPSEAQQRTLDLLEEMTGEVEPLEGFTPGWGEPPTGLEEPEIDGDWQSVAEPMSEAEAFVTLLEQEALTRQVPDEEFEDVEELPEPDEAFAFSAQAARAVEPDNEAMPLGESGDTQPILLHHAQVRPKGADSLNPLVPEILPAGQEPMGAFRLPAPEETPESEVGGGAASPAEEDAKRGALAAIPEAAPPSDPFGEQKPRPRAREIFQPEAAPRPDSELLEFFVDDNRLRELFEQIEALQEEIVQSVRGDRGNTDVYQEELLQASNLLLQSRENYDEARAIVYRIRADLNREKRVDAAIARYRPLILNVYWGAWIIIVVMALLGGLVTSLTEDVGQAWIGQGFYPALAGAVGALLFGYRTLHKHTIIDRDFDSAHVMEYIYYPFKGVIAGFLLYLFLLATSVATLDSNTIEITGSSPVTLLAAVAVGYNQNVVTNLLDSARQRFTPQERRREA